MTLFQVSGRKTGKTTQLLEWMKQAPEGQIRIMVCSSGNTARHAYDKAISMGMEVTRDNFIEIEDCRYLIGQSNIRLCVDNLDCMLFSIFTQPVDFVTATGVDTLHAN